MSLVGKGEEEVGKGSAVSETTGTGHQSFTKHVQWVQFRTGRSECSKIVLPHDTCCQDHLEK